MKKELEKIVLQSVVNEEIILGLAEELEQPESEISKLVDAILVNVILTELSQENRLIFYDLVEKNSGDKQLKDFIWGKIPNINFPRPHGSGC